MESFIEWVTDLAGGERAGDIRIEAVRQAIGSV
jgi:hypothetical protein